METTNNKLSPEYVNFFNKLKASLDGAPIYYYGSVQRYDYYPNSSDVDIAIFSPMEKHTALKIQTLLNISSNKVHPIYKIIDSHKIAHGYKIQYANGIRVEIAIYNDKYKTEILNEFNRKVKLPFHITVLLLILKCQYYDLHIIPRQTYNYLKNMCLNKLFDGSDSNFVQIK